MPFVIKYKTIVADSSCGVTLRGIFEDGKYFGEIVVYDPRFCFNLEGYLNSTCVNDIFESVLFLKSTEPIDADGAVDCWIGEFPIQTQKVFFRHHVNYEYENETKLHYEELINILKSEFDVMIQNKIVEHQHACENE